MTLTPNNTMHRGRWIVIGILFLSVALLFLLPQSEFVLASIGAIIISVFAFWHGNQRYGMKNMIIFFLITWVVSNFFESLSIFTGFPFGNYHYEMPGPRLAEVPLIIMPAYFAMGYVSYMLAHVLTGQYNKKLEGKQVFIVPFIASFIMVMWDLVMDPPASTINQQWIWEEGGTYFNVPISNFMGWFFVVYVFMQIFSIFISKCDKLSVNTNSKLYWLEAAAVYGIQGLSFIIPTLVIDTNPEIRTSSSLICVFTMIFVAILSAVNIMNFNGFSKEE